jgi:hypothetical protein
MRTPNAQTSASMVYVLCKMDSRGIHRIGMASLSSPR